MVKKIFLTTVLFLLLILIETPKVFAESYISNPSAKLQSRTPFKEQDIREKSLKGFLGKYNSPLTPFASEFIKNADIYNLDWRLVTAISGVESTFGKLIPYNSYNGWGWGIYGNNVIRFSSWDEGIKTVSKSLREDYINKWSAEDIYQIGRFYAASPTWANRVVYLMNNIQEFALTNFKDSLSLSL